MKSLTAHDKPGFYIYAFHAGDVVKVGYSTNLKRRQAAIKCALGSAVLIYVLQLNHRWEMIGAERSILAGLSRIKIKGEIFRFVPSIKTRLQYQARKFDRQYRKFYQPDAVVRVRAMQ